MCYFNAKHSVSLSRRIARDRMEFRMEAVERKKREKRNGARRFNKIRQLINYHCREDLT